MAERIELTFLGTGSAIPTVRRNHMAMLLKYKAENILVDCGEGTQRQFRKAGLNPCKVTKILITHWHGDHVFGLPGILQTLILNGYNRKLEIYGPRGTKEWIRKYFDVVGRGVEKLDIQIKEVRGRKSERGGEIVFDEGEYFVEAYEMDHDCPAIGYSFVVKEKKRMDVEKLKALNIPNSPLMAKLAKGETVEINGKRVDGKKLLYVEDARKISFVMDTRVCDNAVELSRNADLLVIESTYSKQESEELLEKRAHLSSVEAAGIAKKAKATALALVHLSQRYEGIPKVIRDEARGVFENVVVPEDLESIEL